MPCSIPFSASPPCPPIHCNVQFGSWRNGWKTYRLPTGPLWNMGKGCWQGELKTAVFAIWQTSALSQTGKHHGAQNSLWQSNTRAGVQKVMGQVRAVQAWDWALCPPADSYKSRTWKEIQKQLARDAHFSGSQLGAFFFPSSGNSLGRWV